MCRLRKIMVKKITGKDKRDKERGSRDLCAKSGRGKEERVCCNADNLLASVEVPGFHPCVC